VAWRTLLVTSMSALLSSSNRTISPWLCQHARCNGVSPSCVRHREVAVHSFIHRVSPSVRWLVQARAFHQREQRTYKVRDIDLGAKLQQHVGGTYVALACRLVESRLSSLRMHHHHPSSHAISTRTILPSIHRSKQPRFQSFFLALARLKCSTRRIEPQHSVD